MSNLTDALTEWLISFSSGLTWYNKLTNKNTKITYLPNFKKYCDYTKTDPEKLIELKLEGLRNTGTTKEYQAEDLLEHFLVSSTSYPLSTKDGIRTAVLSFYKNNRRPLAEIMDVETPESKQRTPKTEDIIDLDNALNSLRDKALLWFIASAPVRLDTLTLLKWRDLKHTNDKQVPYSMLIEAERLKGKGQKKYKGLKQIGFLHSLSASKLDAYKKELMRKDYIINNDSPIFLAYRKEKKISPLLVVQ